MNKRFIVIAGAAVLTFALLAGGSFAWFSARAVAATSEDNGSLADGVQGGMVAGHVDLEVTYDSYTVDGSGNILSSATDTNGKSLPVIVYPGDIAFAADGTALTDVKSVFKYTVTNTSGTDIIARLNHNGLDLGAAVLEQSTSPQINKIASAKIKLYQLLGYNLDKDGIGTLSNGVPPTPSWFYFEKSPKNKDMRFVNYELLKANSFLTVGNMYDVTATSAGPQAWNFYAPPSSISLESTIKGPFNFTSNILNDNVRLATVETTNPVDALIKDKFLYAEMKKGASFTVEYELSMNDDLAFDASTETGANNDLQFAVFALNLEDASTGSSVNNELVAYGVQDLQTAVSDFFAADVWTKFHP